MKSQQVSSIVRRLLPGILAVLAAFWAVVPAAGGEVKMNRVSDTLLEITGVGWRLRYGTDPDLASRLLPTSEGDRAYFSHGGWLRLIDTQKGLVTGRWHFPGSIARLVSEGKQLQVEIEDKMGTDQVFHRSVAFDPSAPAVPYWPSERLSLYWIPLCEPQYSRATRGRCTLSPGKIPTERAKELIPGLEEAVRRDPLSPWLRMALGKLLRDVGDPRATTFFQEALSAQSTDFTELFPISAFLEHEGEHESARAAFERGYRDFWERGNDPRLFTVLIDRLILYSPFANKPIYAATGQPPELVELVYKLQPFGEGTELAWGIYADQMEKDGRVEDPRKWRARAQDSWANSLFPFSTPLTITLDKFLLVTGTCVLAGFLWIFLLFGRYRPQYRLDLAVHRRRGGLARGMAFLNLEYWSRRERIAFFIIVLGGWFTTGIEGQLVQGLLRQVALPFSFGTGSFAGPVTAWYFENRLPATPQRDLLLAIARQQDGEKVKAENLYRSLPQFAESWNNLGVLLKGAGKGQEAQQAFEQALQLDPALAEAALNLGRPPQGFWTEMHQKYLLGRPMIAPPKREHVVHAVLGGSPAQILLRAAFFSGSLFRLFGALSEAPGASTEGGMEVFVRLLVLALAIALLFLIPSREVTQPLAKRQWVWEILFPGIAPLWGFFGGVALVAWSYCLVQLVLLRWGGPYIITAIATPNLTRSYGVPTFDFFQMNRPGWVWLYAAPALLFALNLALVWREKRREGSISLG